MASPVLRFRKKSIASLFSSNRIAPASRTGGPQGTNLTNGTTPTNDQYTGRTQTQQQPQQAQPQRSFWERAWGAVRGVAVTLAATIVTGAIMTGGLGILAGVLIVGGIILATNIGTAFAKGGQKKHGKNVEQIF